MVQSPTELLQDFLDFNPRESEISASKAPSSVFQKMAEKQALDTFHLAAKEVPAYQDFLKKNKIYPEKINSFADFLNVPLTDKKNYLMKYSLDKLLIRGSFQNKSAVTSSSGSSGLPFYWPRTTVQDFGAAKGFDSYLVNTFNIDKKQTLHVNCSGMGVWTAGDYVFLLIKYLSYKYKNNSSVSPGIDLDNSIRILTDVAPFFEQTIIYSYPPFAKDIIDNLPPKLLKKINLKLVVYGEPYTEKWREYMLKRIDGSQKNPAIVSSVLGSSEGGLVGIESLICTYIRTYSNKDRNMCTALFGEERVPTLIQFNPMARYIEIVGNNVVLTSSGGLPLIRYDTHDYGNLISKEEILSLFKEVSGKDLESFAMKENVLMTSMPYLYVFGRNDYTASIYGVLIYPDTIKDILSTLPFSKYFSGKFVMSTEEDSSSNQYLNVVLETKRFIDVKDVAIPAIERAFAEHLKLYSSEYSKLLSSTGQRVYPRIDIRNYGDNEHFSSKNKQRYLI